PTLGTLVNAAATGADAGTAKDDVNTSTDALLGVPVAGTAAAADTVTSMLSDTTTESTVSFDVTDADAIDALDVTTSTTPDNADDAKVTSLLDTTAATGAVKLDDDANTASALL
ncbi:MAG: hypothetical protein ACK56F_21570, partial [bacterium]